MKLSRNERKLIVALCELPLMELVYQSGNLSTQCFELFQRYPHLATRKKPVHAWVKYTQLHRAQTLIDIAKYRLSGHKNTDYVRAYFEQEAKNEKQYAEMIQRISAEHPELFAAK